MSDNNIELNEINGDVPMMERVKNNEVQKIREQERKYPYILIRCFPTVYRQIPVDFVPSDDLLKGKRIDIAVPHPYISGELSDIARELVIEVTLLVVQKDKLRACAIFRENDCVFCELDGSAKPSNEPPSGGINYDFLKKDDTIIVGSKLFRLDLLPGCLSRVSI